MNDEYNAGSSRQMRILMDKLDAINGKKIAWTTIILLSGAYVAYQVTREW